MTTLTNFTRPADPIVEKDLEAKIFTDTGFVVTILSLVFIPPFLASFQPKPGTCKGFAIEGIINIPKGDNNYNSALDRNHDNIACNQ